MKLINKAHYIGDTMHQKRAWLICICCSIVWLLELPTYELKKNNNNNKSRIPGINLGEEPFPADSCKISFPDKICYVSFRIQHRIRSNLGPRN